MDPRCAEACRDVFLPEEFRIADLAVSTAFLYRDQAFRGRCLVTLREHHTELFQLTPAIRTALMEDVTRIAEALFRALRPIKINYDLLGNLVPHIHWHLIPRFREDGVYPKPIWAAQLPPRTLAVAEQDTLIAKIRHSLR
ncbi:MAG TPA: HIT family protein [Candidatus Methylomirabilis sp.]|nr:HIT family protein [Candidatus Methylomirabilis sp.]